jgi:DNA-3-methyladenine glycosylase II
VEEKAGHAGLVTAATLAAAAKYLGSRDRDLARILAADGLPPLWARRPGFSTLLRIILEQQVSLASAKAVYLRVRAGLGRITPARVLVAGERGLRRLGLTRQKAAYCVNLARAVACRVLRLRELAALDDDAARALLTAVTGIGRWTADIYLLMAMGRPDVWPVGDIALAKAAHAVKGLRARPDQERLVRMAAAWRPYRSVAARMLWQHSLQHGLGRISPRSASRRRSQSGRGARTPANTLP